MISGTWFLSSFLMKTVIYKLAHVCPFLFADSKKHLHLYPFICSPLRACERSPCSLMVQAPRTDSLLQNPGTCSPDRTPGMPGSLCGFLCPDSHLHPTRVPFESALWALSKLCWTEAPCSHTGLHTWKSMRLRLPWVVLDIFKYRGWGVFSFRRNINL